MLPLFKSYNSYYEYSQSVFKESRYIHSEETQKFLKTLLLTSKDKQIKLQKDSLLFRAQKGYDEIQTDGQIIVLPYRAERMLPKAEKVKNGRVNPIGIAVLYVADSESTAIAESRPWIHEGVSIASLKLKKTIRILDLSNIKRSRIFYLLEPTDHKIIEHNVWSDVSMAFSRPVTIEDQDRDYIPTQIIGEYFKKNGFDGIKYKSLLSNGNNYALFDVSCVAMINGIVLQVDSIDVKTIQLGNPAKYKENGNYVEYDYISEILPAAEPLE